MYISLCVNFLWELSVFWKSWRKTESSGQRTKPLSTHLSLTEDRREMEGKSSDSYSIKKMLAKTGERREQMVPVEGIRKELESTHRRSNWKKTSGGRDR